MGSSSSKSEEFGHKAFSTNENQHLEIIMARICGEGKHTFSNQQLEEFLHPHKLPEQLVSNLFAFMKHFQSQGGTSKDNLVEVTSNEFSLAMAYALKGDAEHISQFLTFLASGSTEGAELSKLSELLQKLLDVCFSNSPSDSAWSPSDASTERFVKYLLHDLLYKDGRLQCVVQESSQPIPQTFTASEIEHWLLRSLFVQHIVHCAFHCCFPPDDIVRLPSLLPNCKLPARGRFTKSDILSLADVSFIDRCLPHDLRGTWHPVFSTAKQGESFSSLVQAIVNQGPTVLVVKDQDGHVFGGFAAVSWTFSSQFYGSTSCFLFSIAPVMDVYTPSGYNTNFMYLNRNQQTLPNGLGMGGQFDYFGLWLDQDYGKGHSKAAPKCTTFNSPQLSGQQQFVLDTVEVWAVGPEKDELDDTDGTEHKEKKQTILNADTGAKAMLDMIDKANLSDAIREEDSRQKDGLPE